MYKSKRAQIIEWARRKAGRGEFMTVNAPLMPAERFRLGKLKPGTHLGRDLAFLSWEAVPCKWIQAVSMLQSKASQGGKRQWAEVGISTGAYRFSFEAKGERFSVIYCCWEHGGKFEPIAVAVVPFGRVQAWHSFMLHLEGLFTMRPSRRKAYVVGSSTNSDFKPTLRLADVILPDALKADIVQSVDQFFTTGLEAYAALKVPPFRKFLLYGPAGNGKSTLCQALATDQMSKGRVVVYISASDRYGASFSKVQSAAAIASQRKFPIMMVIEELDSYVAAESDQAQILDFLDGFEAPVNDRGTVLMSTTNYPERLEDRILRFGRIDRRWLIPTIESVDDARRLLVHFIGSFYEPENSCEVEEALIGKPRVFVRELALSARQRAAADGAARLNGHLLAALRLLEQESQAGEDFLRASRGEMQFRPGGTRAARTRRSAPDDF